MKDPIARALAGTAVVLVVLAFTPVGSAVQNAVIPSAGSVGTAQLKAGAVTRTKIKRNAVGTAQVADASLKSADFAPGQLPAGAAGPAGPAGAPGNNSLVGFANVSSSGIIRSIGGSGTASVTVVHPSPGVYDVSFYGTFPAGTTTKDRISSFATADTDNFDVASTSLNNSPVPSPTQITIRVFIFTLAASPPATADRDFAVQVLVPTS